MLSFSRFETTNFHRNSTQFCDTQLVELTINFCSIRLYPRSALNLSTFVVFYPNHTHLELLLSSHRVALLYLLLAKTLLRRVPSPLTIGRRSRTAVLCCFCVPSSPSRTRVSPPTTRLFPSWRTLEALTLVASQCTLFMQSSSLPTSVHHHVFLFCLAERSFQSCGKLS